MQTVRHLPAGLRTIRLQRGQVPQPGVGRAGLLGKHGEKQKTERDSGGLVERADYAK